MAIAGSVSHNEKSPLEILVLVSGLLLASVPKDY